MRTLLRHSRCYFAVLTAAALALRIFFVLKFPNISNDGLLYGELAKTWLQHGVYGLSGDGAVVPTAMRLPGYPAFLAALWAIRGLEHYHAAMWVQVFFDVGTCFVVADLARRTVSQRAAKYAFALAALCPFTANYVASALAETLAIFTAALALDLATAALDSGSLQTWAGCGLAIAGGIMVRPDGGILLPVVATYVLLRAFHRKIGQSRAFWAAAVLSACALGPLLPWTVRNWRQFHQFQPLAPPAANNPGEFVARGFHRWIATWIADYVSVEDVSFREEEEPIEVGKLPSRAFDSPQQRTETERLIAAYNENNRVTAELDRQFAALAAQRIHDAPLRYYVWLPALRVTSMWLRPRTETLGIDSRWWDVENDPHDSAIAIALGALNLVYVALAALALLRGPWGRYWGMLLAFVVVRTLFLATLANPEPRYVLECYPAILVFAAAAAAFVFRTPRRATDG